MRKLRDRFYNEDLRQALEDGLEASTLEARGRVDCEEPRWEIGCDKCSFIYKVELWYNQDVLRLRL